MSLIRSARRRAVSAAMAMAAVWVMAAPAAAQDPAPVVVVTGAVDFTNRYNFRGIRQNTDPIAIQPYIDFGFTPFRGDGGLKTVGLNVGSWNSFHNEIDDFRNLDGETTSSKWYESDLYATVGFGFEKASLALTYTSYMSPANLFAHVKELAVKLSVDDSAALGKGALKPYGLVAFELDDHGQADAGHHNGTYVELGVAPGYSGSKASIAVPVKVGLSGHNYYEFGTGTDSKFGFFSIAGIVTVPMGAHANVHFGAEFQAYGDNVKAYNREDTTGIGTIGLGFAF